MLNIIRLLKILFLFRQICIPFQLDYFLVIQFLSPLEIWISIEFILINSSHWVNFWLRILFLMDKIIQTCHNELYVVTFANCLPSAYSVEISLFPAIFNLPVLHLSFFSSFSFLFFSLLPHSYFPHCWRLWKYTAYCIWKFRCQPTNGLTLWWKLILSRQCLQDHRLWKILSTFVKAPWLILAF